jgi:uncharacterized membrane protein YdfJ with MMPL/SSD domain
MEPGEAAAHATATAGSAVVFAGATVVIALVGLLVVNIPFLTVMGLAAAGAVVIAVLIATTLLPALLGFAGHRLARRNRFLTRRRVPSGDNASTRYARFIVRRPVPVVVACLVLLGVVALPALHMKLGLPDGGSKPTDNTERRAYDLLTEGFGPGFNGPLTVVVDAPGLERSQQEQLATAVVAELEEFPNVAAVSPPAQNKRGDITIVNVTPTSRPASDETRDLVVDYEVFLVTRMREAYTKTGDARGSIVTGYGQSGRVVTAAAIIMIGVFAAFLLDPDPVIKSIGLSLAFGVLADAFIVRMTLVPAVMAVLGDSAWKLPRRLDRVVPEIDVEGERLARAG